MVSRTESPVLSTLWYFRVLASRYVAELLELLSALATVRQPFDLSDEVNADAGVATLLVGGRMPGPRDECIDG